MKERSHHTINRCRIIAVSTVLFLVAASLLIVRADPEWAPWVGLADGLVVGLVMGATGLIPDYDYAWDEFWQTTALTFLLGIFALFVYLIRRESPSAFFWVECAAAMLGYAMLVFVPPLIWIAADTMLFLGTFTGWFFSGLFRREIY